MSEPIEKVSGLSILVSAIGTWIGLGCGLGVLVTAVMAVTGVLAQITPPSRAVDALESRLSVDLIAAVSGSLKVAEDGTKLTFAAHSEGGKKSTISYLKNDRGLLERQVDGKAVASLGRCRELKFRNQGALLLASVTDEHGKVIESWALNRWGKNR